jgi:hypothetical protein
VRTVRGGEEGTAAPVDGLAVGAVDGDPLGGGVELRHETTNAAVEISAGRLWAAPAASGLNSRT